jgi:hypothetical protein
MRSTFRQGVFSGLVGALALLAGVVYWVYRATGRVPFPVSRPAPGELTLKLVAPEEVPTHWQTWKAELAPAIDRWRALVETVRSLRRP